MGRPPGRELRSTLAVPLTPDKRTAVSGRVCTLTLGCSQKNISAILFSGVIVACHQRRPSNCISRSPFLGGGRYEQNRIHSDVCSIYAARGTGSDEEIRPIRRIFVPARGGLSVKREHERMGGRA